MPNVKSIEQRLHDSKTVVSQAEVKFIADMRFAAAAGVGYGFMQQVIEWEWQARFPGMAWGPEYFRRQIDDLESRLVDVRKALKKKGKK